MMTLQTRKRRHAADVSTILEPTDRADYILYFFHSPLGHLHSFRFPRQSYYSLPRGDFHSNVMITGDEGSEDESDEANILLPDVTECKFRVDLVKGFQELFQVVKKKRVKIKDTDEAL